MKAKGVFYFTLAVLVISATMAVAVGPLARQASAAGEKPTLAQELENEFAAVAEKVKPTVVYVDVTRPIEMPQGHRYFEFPEPGDNGFPDLRDFFNGPQQWQRREFSPRTAPRKESAPRNVPKARGVGSGVVIDAKNGYILTNNHVVEGATEIGVTLANDKRYVATLKGADPRTDVAVIQIDAEGLQAVQWGDSDVLKVGNWVLAFGQPEGLKYTVTKGIVSAKGRVDLGIIAKRDDIGGYEDFIQTDAVINPGNSGGPLTNIRGELVGINTAIATQGMPVWNGIGFAIPSNLARNIATQLIENGEVTRGYIGVGLADLMVTPDDKIDSMDFRSPKEREAVEKQLELVKKAGPDVKGAYVVEVVKGAPAEIAGVKAGDLIVKVDGKTIDNMAMLRNIVAQAAVGSTVTLEVMRPAGDKLEPVSAKIEVKAQPKLLAKGAGKADGDVVSTELGLTVQTLTPKLADDLALDKDEKGVIITDVEDDSRAAKADLRRDDVITQIKYKGKDVGVQSAEEFNQAVSKIGEKESFSVLVKREGKPRYVKIE